MSLLRPDRRTRSGSRDARLVTEDLAPAIRAALDDPAPRYHERALPLLEPFTAAAVDRVVALDLLPRLLA